MLSFLTSLVAISVNAAPGELLRFVGQTTAGFRDGVGTNALFNHPEGITEFGGILFVADEGNNRIRQVVISSATVTTIAGSGTAGLVNDVGINAQFNGPTGVFPINGNLFVADRRNNQIRAIRLSTGAVSSFAGAVTAGFVNAVGANARFRGPVHLDSNGVFLFASDPGNHAIRQINPNNGAVTTLAGLGTPGFADGAASVALFNFPESITFNRDNPDSPVLYVADSRNNLLRIVSIATGNTLTIAGTVGVAGNLDGAQVGTATLNSPEGITFINGLTICTDRLGNRVRFIENGQLNTLVAGGLISNPEDIESLAQILFIAESNRISTFEFATLAPTNSPTNFPNLDDQLAFDACLTLVVKQQNVAAGDILTCTKNLVLLFDPAGETNNAALSQLAPGVLLAPILDTQFLQQNIVQVLKDLQPGDEIAVTFVLPAGVQAELDQLAAAAAGRRRLLQEISQVCALDSIQVQCAVFDGTNFDTTKCTTVVGPGGASCLCTEGVSGSLAVITVANAAPQVNPFCLLPPIEAIHYVLVVLLALGGLAALIQLVRLAIAKGGGDRAGLVVFHIVLVLAAVSAMALLLIRAGFHTVVNDRVGFLFLTFVTVAFLGVAAQTVGGSMSKYTVDQNVNRSPILIVLRRVFQVGALLALALALLLTALVGITLNEDPAISTIVADALAGLVVGLGLCVLLAGLVNVCSLGEVEDLTKRDAGARAHVSVRIVVVCLVLGVATAALGVLFALTVVMPLIVFNGVVVSLAADVAFFLLCVLIVYMCIFVRMPLVQVVCDGGLVRGGAKAKVVGGVTEVAIGMTQHERLAAYERSQQPTQYPSQPSTYASQARVSSLPPLPGAGVSGTYDTTEYRPSGNLKPARGPPPMPPGGGAAAARRGLPTPASYYS